MTTLISHIYNEEFLLPFFIERHYQKFDQGIILDYGSNDGSLSILKKMAPKWSIIDCSDQAFDALKLDSLVHSIEEKISGVCLVLTVTEFFIGDPRFITQGMVLPSYSLLRKGDDPEIKAGQRFHEVYKTGVSPFHIVSVENIERFTRPKGRKIKVSKEKYPIGRHYEVLGHTPFLIYRVANCLANDEMISRRLQIQHKIPLSDIEQGFGVQHTNYGKGLDLKTINETVEAEVLLSGDISSEISWALEIESQLALLETNSREFNFMRELISKFESNQELIENYVHNQLSFQSDKLAAQMDLEMLRREYEEVVQENQRLSLFIRSSSESYGRPQDGEKRSQKVTQFSAQDQQELLDRIEFLEAQSRRPSYNFSLLISNLVPAIKKRFRKLID
jgi:hypothetical protein